jgi:hypothetical protein
MYLSLMVRRNAADSICEWKEAMKVPIKREQPWTAIEAEWKSVDRFKALFRCGSSLLHER